ncbi:MAG: 2-oxoacid:acceptor oxidoreductase family protein [Spirochaetia bacterium]|nr:2-oxoacid:acceptor oxidoreductase family protein [Spirochaetia bacterium]
MTENIIIAGSGGQGVLTLGVYLARVGVKEGFNVTWLPSYGAEKRGGFSFCNVAVSDSEIYSPVIEEPDTIIVFDQRSLNTYAVMARKATTVIENSSLVKEDAAVAGTKIRIPASDMANDLRAAKVANIVIAGAYIAFKNIFKTQTAETVMTEMLGSKAGEMLEKNIAAFAGGMNYIKEKYRNRI